MSSRVWWEATTNNHRFSAFWPARSFFILRSQGAFPLGFYLLREGWVYRPAPEAPLIRGMPTGPRAFLETAGCVWATALHPKPTIKKALCHTCPFGGAGNKYRFPGLLAGPSGIRARWEIDQWQIRGQKSPSFGWATFGWASCFFDSYAPLV